MRIAHLADTHIHNLKEHENYYFVFEKIYKSLKENKVDYIVHAGDVVNNKVSVTPELVFALKDFLYSLSSIAPVIIVLGNHDGLVGNKDRKDVVSAVASMISKNVIVCRNTESIELSSDIMLHALSIFSGSKPWDELVIDPSKVNIGVYHGTVGSVMLDTGYFMEGISIEELSKFDFMMLGHIHRMQYIDKQRRMWYSGSTVQNSFTESIQKGYLLWDIKDKNDFKVNKFLFDPLYPFQTVQVLSINDFYSRSEDYGVLSNSNILLLLNENTTFEEELEIEKFCINKFGSRSVKIVKKSLSLHESCGDIVSNILERINFSDLSTQQHYIKKHLLEVLKGEDSSYIDGVLELNASLYSEESALMNKNFCTNYRILKMEWGNLFSYGDYNELDVAEIGRGKVVGIFGENFSGKSSVFDVLCFVLWGETTKKTKKNFDILRRGEKRAFGRVWLEIGGEIYLVERELELSKGENVKSKLRFENITTGVCLNSSSKSDTDNVVEEYIGSFEDFLLISFLSQTSDFVFVSNTNTERKNILKRLFNLGVFDKNIKSVNEEIYYLHNKINDITPEKIRQSISDTENSLNNVKNERFVLEKEKSAIEARKSELLVGITKLKNDYLLLKNSFSDIKLDESDIESSLFSLRKKILSARNILRGLKEEESRFVFPRWFKGDDDYEDFDYLLGREQEISHKMEVLQNQKSMFLAKCEQLRSRISDLASKQKENVPCLQLNIKNEEGESIFYSCGLAKEQVDRERKKKKLESELEELERNDRTIDWQIEIRCLKEELELIKKRKESFLRFRNKLKEFRENVIMKRESGERKLDEFLREYKKTVDNLKKIRTNKNNIEKMKEIGNSISKYEFSLSVLEKELKEINAKINFCTMKIGSLEKEISILQKNVYELKASMERMKILKIYKEVLSGKNSILNYMFKEFIPGIEKQANLFLSHFGQMEIRLEFDGSDNLLILYRTETVDSFRGAGVLSGSEKMLVSLAIRTAFSNFGGVPVSNLFILDEPGTAFDSERLSSLEKSLYLLREKFENIFLVTHIDVLKESVDVIRTVEKNRGISYLS
ncbi:MAG: metallophosphoesterase family protein [Patescibacteria group bacterium]|nr:metallophosphoesterase family protein [Patescibacteria group bacterium]